MDKDVAHDALDGGWSCGFPVFTGGGLCGRCDNLCHSDIPGLDHGESIPHRHHASGPLAGVDNTGLDSRPDLGNSFG